MRILIVSSYFPPDICPAATRAGELSRHLAASGGEVTVLTCNPRYPRGFDFPAPLSKHRSYGWHGVQVEEFAVPAANESPPRQAVEELRFYARGLKAARRLSAPDVVIATSPFFSAACLGWRLARLWRRPFIYDMRDLYPDILRFRRLPLPPTLYPYLKGWANRLYRDTSVIVVNQPSLLHTLSGFVDPSRLRMVMNPVSLPAGPAQRRPGVRSPLTVGYAGRWGRGYDFPALLSTIDHVDPSGFTFRLIGGGYWDEEVRRFAAGSRPNLSVHYGWLAPEQLAVDYASWDIAILPVEPRWCLSMWPAKIPELVAHGIVTVISRELPLPPALATCRFIVQARESNAEGYATALEEAGARVRTLTPEDYAFASETMRREFDPVRLAAAYSEVIRLVLAEK